MGHRRPLRHFDFGFAKVAGILSSGRFCYSVRFLVPGYPSMAWAPSVFDCASAFEDLLLPGDDSSGEGLARSLVIVLDPSEGCLGISEDCDVPRVLRVLRPSSVENVMRSDVTHVEIYD